MLSIPFVLLTVLLWLWVTSRPYPTDVQVDPVTMGRQIVAVLYLTLGISGTLAIWLAYLSVVVLQGR